VVQVVAVVVQQVTVAVVALTQRPITGILHTVEMVVGQVQIIQVKAAVVVTQQMVQAVVAAAEAAVTGDRLPILMEATAVVVVVLVAQVELLFMKRRLFYDKLCLHQK
jgi:hypothetical protein